MTKICKQCQGEIPDKAKKCKHCGSRVPMTKKQTLITIFAGSIVLFIILGLGQMGSNASGINSSSSTMVSIGDEAKLKASSDTIPVAIDEKAFDELTKAAVAGDDIGFAQIFLEGRAFPISSGTKVKVIDQTMFRRKIRILEGDKLGMSGWVDSELVVK